MIVVQKTMSDCFVQIQQDVKHLHEGSTIQVEKNQLKGEDALEFSGDVLSFAQSFDVFLVSFLICILLSQVFWRKSML